MSSIPSQRDTSASRGKQHVYGMPSLDTLHNSDSLTQQPASDPTPNQEIQQIKPLITISPPSPTTCIRPTRRALSNAALHSRRRTFPMIEQKKALYKDEETILSFLDDTSDSGSDPYEEYATEEYMKRYDAEIDRTGVFEIDFSKLPFWFDWKPLDLEDSSMVPEPDLDLEDSSMVQEPETNRDFITMLLKVALSEHNTKHKTSLELGKITRTNFHISAGCTFYISFEVIDGDETKPYQAVIRHMLTEIEVYSCKPKPSS